MEWYSHVQKTTTIVSYQRALEEALTAVPVGEVFDHQRCDGKAGDNSPRARLKAERSGTGVSKMITRIENRWHAAPRSVTLEVAAGHEKRKRLILLVVSSCAAVRIHKPAGTAGEATGSLVHNANAVASRHGARRNSAQHTIAKMFTNGMAQK